MASRPARQRLLAWVPWGLPPAAVVLLALLDPQGVPGIPLVWIPLLLVLGAAGAALRPIGEVGLGPGAAAVAVAIPLLGSGGATWLTVAVVAAGAVGRRRVETGGLPWARALRLGSGWVLAAGAAALAWRSSGPEWGAAVGGVTFLSMGAAATLLAEPRWRREPRALIGAMAVDGAAWAGGAGLALALGASGVAGGALLLAAVAALAAEAARQRGSAVRAAGRQRRLERLGRAGNRLVRDASPLADVARRIHGECRGVVSFAWFELELIAAGQPQGRWSAGPDGLLGPGPAVPPEHPPPLPGFHRRVEWRIEERVLEAGGRELALLRLWTDRRRLPADAMAHLDDLVPQLAGLVLRAVLDLEARHDPLTGLASRRALDAALETAFARARAGEGGVAIALLDLDFFKRINDTFGHTAGDRALATVAEVLRGSLRDSDLCARFGGEEFLLLLQDRGGEAALVLADRLRAAVEALELEFEGQAIPLSLSAGVAAYPELHCRDPRELLQLADAALYEAKRLGRNCALLVRGPGRYLDAKGHLIETGEGPPATAPVIFA